MKATCSHCGAMQELPTREIGKTTNCVFCAKWFVIEHPDPPPVIQRPEPRQDLVLGEVETPAQHPMRVWVRENRRLAVGIVAGIPIVVLLACVGLCVVPGFFRERPVAKASSIPQIPVEQGPLRPTNEEVVQVAKDFVRDHLLAPKTAEFVEVKPTVQVEREGFVQWDVRGKVDSQNTYGTFLRGEFVAIFNHDGKEYAFVYLTLGDNVLFADGPTKELLAKIAEREKQNAEDAKKPNRPRDYSATKPGERGIPVR